MADNGAGLIEQLKSCIVWCWAYFWTVWFFVMLFLVNILRLPFRYNDSNAGEVSVNNSFSVSQACKLQKLLVGRPVKTTRHVYVVGLAQLASWALCFTAKLQANVKMCYTLAQRELKSVITLLKQQNKTSLGYFVKISKLINLIHKSYGRPPWGWLERKVGLAKNVVL